jgi:hypothetical protein
MYISKFVEPFRLKMNSRKEAVSPPCQNTFLVSVPRKLNFLITTLIFGEPVIRFPRVGEVNPPVPLKLQ